MTTPTPVFFSVDNWGQLWKRLCADSRPQIDVVSPDFRWAFPLLVPLSRKFPSQTYPQEFAFKDNFGKFQKFGTPKTYQKSLNFQKFSSLRRLIFLSLRRLDCPPAGTLNSRLYREV
jgi:hypothetical protein